MTFTSNNLPKQCYKACDKEIVDSGQCVCANRWLGLEDQVSVDPEIQSLLNEFGEIVGNKKPKKNRFNGHKK